MESDMVRAGPALAAGPFRIREVAYAAGYRQPMHAHAAAGLTLVVSGAIRETAAGREEAASALSVVVKPAGVEHADEVGASGAHTLQVLFDPDEAGALLGDEVGFGPWRWLHGRRVAGEMLALLRLVRRETAAASGAGGAAAVPASGGLLDLRLTDRAGAERSGHDPSMLDDRALDALAAVLEAVRGAPDGGSPRGVPPEWIRRVKEALDDEPGGGVQVRELARGAGAHAVSVSRAFRRHYGCTISDYRRRQRLRRAAGWIAGTGEGISRIAHAAGYADHPHLCREFRETVGLAPSQFRRLSHGGRSASARPPKG